MLAAWFFMPEWFVTGAKYSEYINCGQTGFYKASCVVWTVG